MAATWVDFKQLKADVALEQVMACYGVHLRCIGATELRGRCPLPTHSSSRSRDSFAVNITRNVWSCRSMSCMAARGGRTRWQHSRFRGPHGALLDPRRGAPPADWSGAAPERFIVPRALRPDPVTAENPPLRFALQYVDARHPYLASRGVTPESVRTFGPGLYTGTGLLRGRIVVPIHKVPA